MTELQEQGALMKGHPFGVEISWLMRTEDGTSGGLGVKGKCTGMKLHPLGVEKLAETGKVGRVRGPRQGRPSPNLGTGLNLRPGLSSARGEEAAWVLTTHHSELEGLSGRILKTLLIDQAVHLHVRLRIRDTNKAGGG